MSRRGMIAPLSGGIIILIITGLAHSHMNIPSHQFQWQNITHAVNRGALCNDFTTAGYFIRRQEPFGNTPISKWVIFLESGGGCTTPRSCNERYIEQEIRRNYTRRVNGTRYVDVEQAWNDYRDRPSDVTSKLMTSLWMFSKNSRQNNRFWSIEGRGILSKNTTENPNFHDYNHVLIPYCSSDLWLKKTKNYVLAWNNSFRFQFEPNATHHQFTFRGTVIFESVIEDLFEYHKLRFATDVILAGSSAGGVGAMNHASWLRQQLLSRASPESTVYCLLDSSWFIDFRGSIKEQFDTTEIQSLISSKEVHENCRSHIKDPDVCVSSTHFLTHYKDIMKDIPTLALFSRYDLYLLISSLQFVDTEVLSIMRVVSEYSGGMNTSLLAVTHELPNFSYFVTSCFQHVYLATSSLWGEEGLFGTAGEDGELENNRFEHEISSEVWTSFHLEYLNSSQMVERISVRQAIHTWLEAAKQGDIVRYHDYCNGPHCNPQCPETIILGETEPYWGIEAQAVLLALVVLVSLGCVVLKLLLSLRAKYHSHKQKQFVEWNRHNVDDGTESALPYCKDSDAISVACLNLRYSVTVKKSALNKVYSPTQRKRLLSQAAADAEPVRTWRCEDGEGSGKGGDSDYQRRKLDSETGQAAISEENEFATSIRRFQEMHNQKGKSKSRHTHRHSREKQSNKKEILKGITTYFNPGELVAIMGPSGSGKTTFLDLLAGRRNDRESYQGELLVNGTPIDEIRDWYVANTGYVLQLATPYYEELTVRENITLAAQMRLPKSLSLEERFERVEQVMKETGLHSLASTVVGGATGTGLSGGQKRRLCVALQLINMPSFIFLDEPTSGLDAASSLELLSHLHRVASSNRAVVLTIHQPRLEIFHMFDKVILLCQGQIAYHGIPEKAYEVFLEAHQAEGRRMDSLQSKNPADAIMDMLGSEEARAAILSYYQSSDEPDAVENAIEEVRSSGRESVSSRQVWVQRSQQESGTLNRVSCLESRASRRAGLGQVLYLPVIFAVYGILLGTVYIQTNSTTLLLSGYGVFSCASGLFMFPIIYTYLYRALEIFTLEYSDGVGSPVELVLQTFLRFSSLALLPNVFCSTAIYLLAVPYTQYDPWVFTQITVFALAVSHTWIALLVFVITTRPGFAHRISPVLSAIAGFAGGFFVPPRLMPPWYSWLFYINPNFYGFSAMARVLLQDIDLGCEYQSPIECYPSSGAYLLTYFDLHTINPYLNTLVLVTMTAVFLGLACLSLSIRHVYVLQQLKKIFSRKAVTEVSKTKTTSISDKASGDKPHPPHDTTQTGIRLTPSIESILTVISTKEEVSEEFKKVETKPCQRPFLSTEDLTTQESEETKEEKGRRFRLKNRGTISRMLQDGENHQVWSPRSKCSSKRPSHVTQISLEERRKSMFLRMNTYRYGGSNSSDRQDSGVGPLPSVGTLNSPGGSNVARRIAQWKKIEEEASRFEKAKREGNEINSTPSSIEQTTSDLVTLEFPLPLPTSHPRVLTTPSNPSPPSPSNPSPMPLPPSPHDASNHLPVPQPSPIVYAASNSSKNAGITNLGSSLSGASPAFSSGTLQTKRITPKSVSFFIATDSPKCAQEQPQPQHFVFPELPNSTAEQTPKDSSVGSLNTEGLGVLHESGSFLTNNSIPVPGFQVHNSLTINSPPVQSQSPTSSTTPTLSQFHTSPLDAPPTHTASHPYTTPSPMQLQNTKLARFPNSPLIFSVSAQERRQSGGGVFTMDSIQEETSSEIDVSPSNDSLVAADGEADNDRGTDEVVCDVGDKFSYGTLSSTEMQEDDTSFPVDISITGKSEETATGKNQCVSSSLSSTLQDDHQIKADSNVKNPKRSYPEFKKLLAESKTHCSTQDKSGKLYQVLGIHDNLTQEVANSQGGNETTQSKQKEVKTNHRPISVSRSPDPLWTFLATPSNNDQTEVNPLSDEEVASTQPLYVVKSPVSSAEVTNDGRTQVSDYPHKRYQQTDF